MNVGKDQEFVDRVLAYHAESRREIFEQAVFTIERMTGVSKEEARRIVEDSL